MVCYSYTTWYIELPPGHKILNSQSTGQNISGTHLLIIFHTNYRGKMKVLSFCKALKDLLGFFNILAHL